VPTLRHRETGLRIAALMFDRPQVPHPRFGSARRILHFSDFAPSTIDGHNKPVLGIVLRAPLRGDDDFLQRIVSAEHPVAALRIATAEITPMAIPDRELSKFM